MINELLEDIQSLIDDEAEAIEAYARAIALNSENEDAVKLFKHIREEEIEHYEELIRLYDKLS